MPRFSRFRILLFAITLSGACPAHAGQPTYHLTMLDQRGVAVGVGLAIGSSGGLVAVRINNDRYAGGWNNINGTGYANLAALSGDKLHCMFHYNLASQSGQGNCQTDGGFSYILQIN